VVSFTREICLVLAGIGCFGLGLQLQQQGKNHAVYSRCCSSILLAALWFDSM